MATDATELNSTHPQQPARQTPRSTEVADSGARRYPRSKRSLMVDYLVEDRVYRDFIENISGGGVYIATRGRFEIGQNVVLTFLLPESRSPVRNRGVVVRRDGEGIGVQFSWN